MRMLDTVAVFCLVILGSGTPAGAHHSFSAEFDVNKPVTLRGTLTKMAWTNPHSQLYVDVTDEEGRVVNWRIELGSPSAMMKRGLSRDDFPPGLQVVVEGYLAKDGSSSAFGVSIRPRDSEQLLYGLDVS